MSQVPQPTTTKKNIKNNKQLQGKTQDDRLAEFLRGALSYLTANGGKVASGKEGPLIPLRASRYSITQLIDGGAADSELQLCQDYIRFTEEKVAEYTKLAASLLFGFDDADVTALENLGKYLHPEDVKEAREVAKDQADKRRFANKQPKGDAPQKTPAFSQKKRRVKEEEAATTTKKPKGEPNKEEPKTFLEGHPLGSLGYMQALLNLNGGDDDRRRNLISMIKDQQDLIDKYTQGTAKLLAAALLEISGPSVDKLKQELADIETNLHKKDRDNARKEAKKQIDDLI